MGHYGNTWREKPKEEEEKSGRDVPNLNEGSALSHRLGFLHSTSVSLGTEWEDDLGWGFQTNVSNMEEDVRGERMMRLSVLLPLWAFTTHMPMFISRFLRLAGPFSANH